MMENSTVLDRVVVINDFSIARGGATALALLSAFGLAQRGVPVTYLCGDAASNADFPSHGIEAIGLGHKALLESESSAAVRGLYNLDAARLLAQWIEQHDTSSTMYHLHNWAHILSPAIFGPLKSVKGRVVLSTHDFFLTCPNGAYMNYPRGTPCALRPLSSSCLLANCDKRNYAHKSWRVLRQAFRESIYHLREQQPKILVLHGGMRSYLERGGVPANCIDVLLNPITPFTEQRIQVEGNREFLFVGRLDYEKGADLAAAAAREANVPLQIVGDGPLRATLEAQYPEMTFHGFLSKASIRELAVAARALVMPTRYPEPFGLSAVEALWSGLPVVLPKSSFLAPEVDALGAGILFDAGDQPGLARAMRHIADDVDHARGMSEIAFTQTRALANTPESWIVKLHEQYCRMIDRH
ncbi:MAG: glycosyltransferase family 4 protein [Rhizomicrobium sp.]|nr:glycosyltransferase family 4 protein [Rhizomicrobium sp.]